MATTYYNTISQLYVAYFNRPAEGAGLAYWQSVLESQNGNTAAVSAAFAGSAEYQFAYAGMSASQTVAKVYQNLFGRPAELAGLSYWAPLLESGALSIDRIVKNIADGAQGSDKKAFANKVTAALAFSAALDTPQEVAAYARTDLTAAAKAFLSGIDSDASLAVLFQGNNLDSAVEHFTMAHIVNLTTGQDVFNDNVGHNTWMAPILGGSATLSSADSLTGGARTVDTLKAELPNQSGVLVAPRMAAIEHIELRAVEGNFSANAEAVRFDAGAVQGMRSIASVNSDADLRIDNIRLEPTQATRELSIEMRGSAAGNGDFGVYFAHDSLVSSSVSNSALRLQLMDSRSAAQGLAPLLESFYDRFSFGYNGKVFTLQSKAIDDAVDYDQLLAAVKTAVAATPGLEKVAVTLGAPFSINSSLGTLVSGRDIVLSGADGDSFTQDGNGWGSNGLIGNGTIHNLLRPFNHDGVPHVTASIILDDVGRGGQSGDLVVGSMQGPGPVPAQDLYVPGASAITLPYPSGLYKEGVERFEIEVRNNSSLQTIGSTNNALREVVIRNGYASASSSIDHASLAVLGASGPADPLLPNATFHNPGMGFTDVRIIDASGMHGMIKFSAEVTAAALAKYSATPLPGVFSAPLTTDIVYSGGRESDTIGLTLNGEVLASMADVLAAIPSFTVRADGGAGDDTISLTIVAGGAGWSVGQALGNVRVNGGDGNDTVRVNGPGKVIIDLGAGDDRFVSASEGAGDTVLTGGSGNDHFTLGKVLGAQGIDSSNDTLVYQSGGFGNDVVINFSAGAGPGADQLDLRALGGRAAFFSGAAISNLNDSITVQVQSGANDSAAKIAALYADSAAPGSHVFVAVDAANLGRVYSIADTAQGPVIATLVGSIDLGATDWTTLVAANFA